MEDNNDKVEGKDSREGHCSAADIRKPGKVACNRQEVVHIRGDDHNFEGWSWKMGCEETQK